MAETYHKTLETLWGTGVIYDGAREVARVRYRLRVAQEMIVTGDAGARRERAGPRTTSGGVELLDGGPLETGHTYRLQLADGRRLHVEARPRPDIGGMVEVSGAEPR